MTFQLNMKVYHIRNAEHLQQGRIIENRTLTLHMDGRGSITGRDKNFSVFHNVENGSRAHSSSSIVYWVLFLRE
jgi:hypothetical protein